MKVAPDRKILSQELSEAELLKVGEIARSARIFGIGECIHGSATFHSTAYSLARYLIETCGYRIFLLEAPSVGVDRLQDYIDGLAEDPVPLLDGCFRTWRSRELLAFLSWARKFNAITAGNGITLRGFDIQNPSMELELLRNRDYLPSSLLKFFEKCGKPADQKFSSEWVQSFQKTILAHPPCVDANLYKEIAELTSKYDGVSTHVGFRRYEVSNFFRKVGAWLELFEAYPKDPIRAVTVRDAIMAREIAWVSRAYNQKALIFGHTGHLVYRADILRPINEYQGNGPLMGAHLKKEFGADYRAIGLVAHKVTVWDIPITKTRTIHFSNGLEGQLHKDRRGATFLDCSELGEAETEIGSPSTWEDPEDENGSKMIGVMKHQLDALIYLPEAEAFEPI